MRNRLPPNSIKYRLFLSFSAIVVGITLLFWLVSIAYLSNQYRGEQKKDFSARAEQVLYTVQNTIERSWQYADTILLSSFARNMAAGYYDYLPFEVAQYLDQFNSNITLNPDIDGAFLYFPTKDTVLSSIAPIEDAAFFFAYDLGLDGQRGEALRDALYDTSYRAVLAGDISYLISTKQGFLLIQRDVLSRKGQAPMLGMIIPFDSFSLHFLSEPDSGVCVIVHSGDRRFVLGDSATAGLVDTMLQDESTPGEIIEIRGQRQVGYAVRYEMGHGIAMTVVQQEGTMLGRIHRVQGIVSAALLCCTLLAMAFVYVNAKRQAQPITELLAIFQGEEAHALPPSGNEIHALHTGIADLLQREQAIRESLERTLPEFRRYLLERILDGRQPWETLRMALHIAGLDVYGQTLWMQVLPAAPASETLEGQVYTFLYGQVWLVIACEGRPAAGEADAWLHVPGWRELRDAYLYQVALLSLQAPAHQGLLPPASAYGIPAEPLQTWEAAVAVGSQRKMEAISSQILLGDTDDVVRMAALVAYLCATSARRMPDQAQAAQLHRALTHAHTEAALQAVMADHIAILAQARQAQEEDARRQDYRRRILQAIDDGYLQADFSLTTLAETLGVHRTYLSGMLNEYFEEGLVGLVSSRRLAHSQRLITQTDLPYGEIALASGFQSDATFRRAFKKKYGVTPSEYRALHGENT